MRPITIAAMIGLITTAGVAQATTVSTDVVLPSTTDPFNGAIVDASAALVGGFSAEDAFGAVTPGGTYGEALAGGHTIFADAASAFINFHTLATVTIGGFNLFLSGDGRGSTYRGFTSVSLFASTDDGRTFATLLGQASYDPALGGVVVSNLFAPITAQYFRFEGTTPNGGGRVMEIDAIPGVPEPATWAMLMLGFGGIGYALRRRQTVDGARIRFA